MRRATERYMTTNKEAGVDMARQERSHARILSMLASPSHRGWDGPAYSRLEGRRGAGAANNLRAMVLGANDGLVSTFCLLMGVARGRRQSTHFTGHGGSWLFGGRLLNGDGEWISLQSARELQEKQIASEAEELAASPAEEQEELSLIYRQRLYPR